ncbi:DNA polymerase III subunit chi [Meridianimarinicoccus roseus]|jgi:DNA polymerase-3 subunit chi|uniref:DNA polymerase III subunit chi n=1 Tax=Meridianimarinicoccus roseus TaxID=2072018 RepID=A0A2V2LI42_9RHOB|nr:DNA polymerase III subunit chi [Meridianimarinicoccus roseus]PWR03234.1 DNA polymerase III subunit chi [Meridianimarinicoccus roseus]
MGVLRFYHLTRAPVEQTLARLLRRAVDAGMRVQLRCPDAARADWFDQKLWLSGEDPFLPHGLAGGPHDALQPVLLCDGDALHDGISCLMSVEGAPVQPEEAAQVDRAFILFDGHDTAALDHARGQWKALTGAGLGAEYWSEASGRWAMERSVDAAG